MAFGTKPVNKQSDALWFLKEASAKLGWDDLSEDVVMDIGCGTGNASTTLLELFPNVKKIIAIDLYPKIIEEAQANNPHEKLQYEVADIEDSSKLTQFEDKITKAISTYCFNTLRRVQEAFKNVSRILSINGEAALLIKLRGPFDILLERLYTESEWVPYLPPFSDVILPPHIRKMASEDFALAASRAGFKVIECRVKEHLYYFDTEEEFRNSLVPAIPIVKKMDENVAVKFNNYLFEFLVKLHPKKVDGKFCLPNNILVLLLRKI
ncbi:Juvenile hormone acid O-methyltransferase like protein [Argiope bruennichi]|uniref:Juvenile hormone acid O-methyltransferase like protein n=2 Tax=Argiope bruennichi TaxID=94029 RepID=A0A8T0EQB1_ARGBR|nr:Juvenile hormone acid O-methyltransferase like protein [Argiope bruennichi]